MKIYIVVVLMLLALVNMGYSQDQVKNDSLDAVINNFDGQSKKIPSIPEARRITWGLCIVEKGVKERGRQ